MTETNKTWVSWYTPSGAVFERFKKDIITAGYSHKADMSLSLAGHTELGEG